MSPASLTVLMATKGRHLHTLRFLWHANQCRLPWRILIADGQVHPTIAKLLEDPDTFPNLGIGYIRYREDENFTKFFQKMADATDRVRTPYVMLMDNDDLIVPSGVGPSIEFLDNHPDYVCSGGGIAGFELYAPSRAPLRRLTGPISRLTYRYGTFDQSNDYSNELVTERVCSGFRDSWAPYAVMRSAALKTIWREIREIDFSDLLVFERFWIMRILTLGKVRSDPSLVSSLRQYDTSLRAAYKIDWVDHLLHSKFNQDFDATIDRISSIAATTDGMDRLPIADKLRQLHVDRWMRPFIKQEYGAAAPSILLKRFIVEQWPELGTRLKRFRYIIRRDRDAFLARLRRDGATEAYRETFAQEMKGVEAVLTGPEFRAFLREKAPDLLAEAQR